MIERMDEAIGRVLKALEGTGQATNTLVIFASDNGGTASARSCGLRDIKSSTFEGGIRVPCIARWSGVLPAGVEYLHPAATFDLTVSIAHAAGVKAPAGQPFDGIDILRSALRGEAPPARTLFWRGRRGQRTWHAVREGALKLVARADGARRGILVRPRMTPANKPTCFLTSADATRLRTALALWEVEVKPRS